MKLNKTQQDIVMQAIASNNQADYDYRQAGINFRNLITGITGVTDWSRVELTKEG